MTIPRASDRDPPQDRQRSDKPRNKYPWMCHGSRSSAQRLRSAAAHARMLVRGASNQHNNPFGAPRAQDSGADGSNALLGRQWAGLGIDWCL
jgi:hypothetical protein